MNQGLVIGMAGSGGDGIVSAGDSLMTALALAGYHAMLTKSFGPQIRGGESSFRLRVSTGPVLGPGGALDVAVALNWDDFLKFGAELPVDGHTVVIYDSNTRVAPDQIPLAGVKPAEVVPVGDRGDGEGDGRVGEGQEHRRARPDGRVVRPRARSTSAPASASASPRRARTSWRATSAPSRRASPGRRPTRCASPAPLAPVAEGTTAKMVADGNDLCAAAAIFAGCQFFGGYPITPSSEVMQFLNREIWKYGGTMLQCEDEIAGVGACVGASFAGKKALTATSGPGMSLKTEMIGLATISRAAARRRQRAARRPVHRHPDQERAVGPVPGRLLGARRRAAPGAGADERRRHVPDHGGGVQHRRAVPDAGDHPVGPGDRPAQGGHRPAGHRRASSSRNAASRTSTSSSTTCASGSPIRASARSATRG